MTTYRYAWKGLDQTAIARSISPSLSGFTIAGPSPAPVIDVTVNSSSNTDKEDLDDAMLKQGWAYSSTDPPAPPKGIILRQEIGTRVISDSSTTSTSFEDLLTVSITTEAGVLGLIVSACSTAMLEQGYFRITVDGVTVTGGAHMVGLASMFLGVRVPITPGPHTVKLQWRTDTLGTHRVNAVSAPEAEFANLLVREMSG